MSFGSCAAVCFLPGSVQFVGLTDLLSLWFVKAAERTGVAQHVAAELAAPRGVLQGSAGVARCAHGVLACSTSRGYIVAISAGGTHCNKESFVSKIKYNIQTQR